MTTTSSVASISAADVAFYDAAARKRMLGLKLIIRAIDGSLYQAEADEDIQLFIRSETLFDQERTRFQHRHSGVCIPCCYLCNILLCISDPCNNPYPKSRTKEQVIVGMGVSKPYWRASELLHMTALLHDGLQRLQQHGPGQLCAAHAECDAQERMAFKRGPLPMGGPAPSSQAPYGAPGFYPQHDGGFGAPPATYSHAMQPVHAMPDSPPKQNVAEQLAQISQLKASGVLSQEQFDQAFAKVMASS